MKHIALILIVLALFVSSCGSENETSEFVVRKGKFEASVTETGDLQAINARLITMPYVDWRFATNEFKILYLKENGAMLKKGDTVAVIDDALTQKSINDMITRYESEEASLNKIIINHSIKEQDVKTDLAIKEASYNTMLLQVEKSKFDTEKKQKIRKYELEKATISLSLARSKSKTVLASSLKQIQIQKIRLKRMANDIKFAKSSLSQFILRSPGNGIMQISRNRSTRLPFKIGDKVNRGSEVASVPDLSRMKVLSNINETDISKISTGLPVTIRLDAYPSVAFEGTISRISKVCRIKNEESNRKVFDFEIVMKKNDPLLKPGMTVSCEVFYSKLKDALYVNNSCIYYSDSVQFVMLADGMKKCPVKLGPGNNLYTTVSGEVPVGALLVPIDKDQTSKKL